MGKAWEGSQGEAHTQERKEPSQSTCNDPLRQLTSDIIHQLPGGEGLKAGKRDRIFSITFPRDEKICVMDKGRTVAAGRE